MLRQWRTAMQEHAVRQMKNERDRNPFRCAGRLQFAGRCSPLPHRITPLRFLSRKKDGGLRLRANVTEERRLSSLLFQESAETVTLSATCMKARGPHLLITCDQPPAGDADVRNSVHASKERNEFRHRADEQLSPHYSWRFAALRQSSGSRAQSRDEIARKTRSS